MAIEDILEERGMKYGDYGSQANITVSLFNILMGPNPKLENYQTDAIYMFCVKLARIVNGDPDYPDNWDDIAGYATLVSTLLKATGPSSS